jgi:hypothetical protein
MQSRCLYMVVICIIFVSNVNKLSIFLCNIYLKNTTVSRALKAICLEYNPRFGWYGHLRWETIHIDMDIKVFSIVSREITEGVVRMMIPLRVSRPRCMPSWLCYLASHVRVLSSTCGVIFLCFKTYSILEVENSGKL